VALIDDERDMAYMRSTAVIMTFLLMRFPYWVLYYPMILMPRVVRDAVYHLVSKYRM